MLYLLVLGNSLSFSLLELICFYSGGSFLSAAAKSQNPEFTSAKKS
jgi:hypothetical protein